MKRYISAQTHELDLHHAAFLVFSSKDEKQAVGFWVPENEVTKLSPEFFKVKVFSGLAFVPYAMKVVASESMKPHFEELHQKLQLKGSRVSVYSEHALVRFEPHTGLFQVKKDAPKSAALPTQSLTQNSSKGEASVVRPEVRSGTNKDVTRVLIVDDSPTIRQILKRLMSEDDSLMVVGETGDPTEVMGLISRLKPNVITLDIHMPKMTGVDVIKQVMPAHRLPTVMVTSVAMEDGPLVMEALENGAVDYIQKPSFEDLDQVGPLIIEKIKLASKANMAKVSSYAEICPLPIYTPLDLDRLIAFGSSTGGTEALKTVLTQLPPQIPPIVMVQHIPEGFSKSFADRLNTLCRFEVLEAKNGDEIKAGRALLAPGGKHMRIKKIGTRMFAEVIDTEPVNRHKPSVDVLFDSVAQLCKDNAIGIMLTGMGADGAKGMKKMKDEGAQTIAQSEKTCVVFGMPKEAIKAGGVDSVLDLEEIPHTLVEWLQHKRAA